MPNKIIQTVLFLAYGQLYELREKQMLSSGLLQLNKTLLIVTRSLVLYASAKIAKDALTVLKDISAAVEHYNPDSGKPPKVPAELCDRLQRALVSYEKLSDGRMSEIQAAQVAIDVDAQLTRLGVQVVSEHEKPELIGEKLAVITGSSVGLPSWMNADFSVKKDVVNEAH